ncbi:hypothetical protein HKD37_06G017047 [Glycine soja]
MILWLELLRRTLGRVLGRVLGRQVVGDKEETPQRRMPTAYARRQRATAGVTGDVNHVDHAANEESQKPVTGHVECTELKLASHVRKVEKFGRHAPEIEGIVATTGLTSLITCLLETSDTEISSFHMLIGELTITLDDVASLLHMSITGVFHTFDAIDVEEVLDLLVELLEISTQKVKDETEQCRWTYLHKYYKKYN